MHPVTSHFLEGDTVIVVALVSRCELLVTGAAQVAGVNGAVDLGSATVAPAWIGQFRAVIIRVRNALAVQRATVPRIHLAQCPSAAATAAIVWVLCRPVAGAECFVILRQFAHGVVSGFHYAFERIHLSMLSRAC